MMASAAAILVVYENASMALLFIVIISNLKYVWTGGLLVDRFSLACLFPGYRKVANSPDVRQLYIYMNPLNPSIMKDISTF